ncbi:MAG: hypothetical protein JRH11_01590 [Deltaproteobacteria bacterium]|nr:hypothetical protein [Deltaproteobacteria bacterium]
MKAILRNSLVGGALVAQLLSGCTTEPASDAVAKPAGKADAVSRLCADAGEPADCDICDVRSWYDDGECDEFCASPDPDCGTAAPVCSFDFGSPLGSSTAELWALSGRARRVLFEDIDSLTSTEVEQIIAAVTLDYSDVEGLTREDLFALADAGEFFLVPVTLGGVSYDWVRFYSGDTEVGTVFEDGTTRPVASGSDGDLRGCTAPEGPSPDAPSTEPYTCDYSPHPFADASYDLEPVSGTTYERSDIADVPEITAAQILYSARYQTAVGAEEDLVAAFDIPDDHEFDVLRLEVGGAQYDWVRWWSGDTEVGTIFDADAMSMVAEIGDQEVIGCRASDP